MGQRRDAGTRGAEQTVRDIRVEPGFKRAAERAAKADRRSLTTYIEKLIEDDLRKTGQTIGKPARKRK